METKHTRRKFLRSGLLAVAGSSVATPAIAGAIQRSKNKAVEKKIVYRTLGKTGIKLPIVSMGTGNTDNPALIKAAMDKGVKLFATSEYYHNGNNEKMLGGVFKNKPRDSFYILTGTNGGLEIDYKNGVFKPETNSDVFLESANGCLKRLQVEYVDIFSLGYAARREFVFYDSILKALEKFKKQGKTKYLGIGTHKFEPEAIRAAADTGVFDIVMTAYNFRKNNMEEMNAAINYAATKGMGIIAMKTMAGAYWDKKRTQPINTKAALKWVLNNKNIHTTVPDCSNFDQLDQDLGLMSDLTLTEDEKRDLKPPADGMTTGIYCQQCGDCISQCRESLDIPTVMRSYMYAYGYKNPGLAQQTLKTGGIPVSACVNCASCSVHCTMGFDVRGKLTDIKRLMNVPVDFLA